MGHGATLQISSLTIRGNLPFCKRYLDGRGKFPHHPTMVDVEKLLTRVSNYARKSKRSEVGIGKELFDDAKAFPQLKEGWRGISLKRLQKASDRLAELEAKISPAKKKPNANRVAA